MTLSLIVAMDLNALIGRENQLPWRLPADLRHFKQITMGRPMIMGRRTCESLPGLLPGRRHVVLTRQTTYQRTGCDVFTSVDSLMNSMHPADEAIVIGGAEIYRLLLPHVVKAYVTIVQHRFKGDTWFPEWPLAGFAVTSSTERAADEANPYPMTFVILEKLEKDLSIG